MAVRSGAGTGVVVSLVVFILTTVFLLILTIVFYSGQNKALEQSVEADNRLAVYVRSAERNNETFKQFEDSARNANESVTRHLYGRLQDMTQYVDGAPNASAEQVKANFARLGVADDGIVRNELQDSMRALQDSQDENDRLRTQLQARDDENAELNARMDQMRRAHQEASDEVETQIAAYREAAEEFRRELDNTVATMEERVARLNEQHRNQVLDLQRDVDDLGEERVLLINRVQDLEAKVRQEQIASQDPALLVDGRIIDSVGSSDQVFIDRGRQHHIMLGMSFEVYDDQAALQQVDLQTGELPRGKASLQVIKVGETTSTCKVVRAVPGRPVVRNDVIANAVYDPRYVFKFLVHGKFDVDNDGRPTEAEAVFLRSLVIDWGGEVISGDEMPGDLDFLVLGEEPPLPSPLRADAPKHEMDSWVKKRQAYETYRGLLEQATNAQIPVLNANRFFILTGYTVR